MRILLVSEGEHEQGGALRAIVQRLAPTITEIKQKRVQSDDLPPIHGRMKRYEKKALRWIAQAQRDRFDAMVLLVDEDGQRGIVQGIDAAQDEQTYSIPRALGVAIRSFDAWILADEKALTRTLGFSVACQPDPEAARDPKSQCAALLGQSEKSISQRQMYAVVAEACDLEKMRTRCPKGFAPFAQRVAKLETETER